MKAMKWHAEKKTLLENHHERGISKEFDATENDFGTILIYPPTYLEYNGGHVPLYEAEVCFES